MVVRIRFALIAITMASAPAGANAQAGSEVRCDYTKRQVCSADGCKPFPVGSAFLVVPGTDAIHEAIFDDRRVELRRCDDRGCTPVRVIPTEGGIFLNMMAPEFGVMVKIATQEESITGIREGEFSEAATQLLTTYLGWGQCRARGK